MTKEEKRLYQEGFKDGFEAAKKEFKKVEYEPYVPWNPWNPYYPYYNYPYYNYDKWTVTTTPYVGSSTKVFTGQNIDTSDGKVSDDYFNTHTITT